MRPRFLAPALAALLVGCGGDGGQPAFPDLHPVKGVLKRGGQPVVGGSVRFTPEPDRPGFAVNSEVGPDGTFSLSTVRTTDKAGERRSGAPTGKYRVTYMPPAGDQAAGGVSFDPIEAPSKVTVAAQENDLTIELTKK
jgi:hypothetical protein